MIGVLEGQRGDPLLVTCENTSRGGRGPAMSNIASNDSTKIIPALDRILMQWEYI